MRICGYSTYKTVVDKIVGCGNKFSEKKSNVIKIPILWTRRSMTNIKRKIRKRKNRPKN